MKTFSQGREQEWVIRHFGPKKGTFLDIGANDGSTLSNIRALALMGWHGVCVEPSPVAFGKLSELYRANPNIELVNVGMCDTNRIETLHESGEHLGRGDHSLLSTAKAGEMERWKGATFNPVEMECVTFAELLTRTRFATFDFITIDCEGFDLEVLRQMDLTAIGCRMLCVEFNGKDEALFTEHCTLHGMKLRHKNAENLIFVR
jgi:FkbM family methyltransferase